MRKLATERHTHGTLGMSLRRAVRRNSIAIGLAAVFLGVASQTVHFSSRPDAPLEIRNGYPVVTLDKRVAGICSTEKIYMMPRQEFNDCVDLSIISGKSDLILYADSAKAKQLGIDRYEFYEQGQRELFISTERERLASVIRKHHPTLAQVGGLMSNIENRIIAENAEAVSQGAFGSHPGPGGWTDKVEGLLCGLGFIVAVAFGFRWQMNR
ncbi:MAG TPA: hypothetical protein VL945_00525 [Candidatus Saccharimonadales bacterium]|nr:hypothetical protein [Candidatus Saccharimonadales bacterium]